jgi:tripartite-type tricarboxylate transporter receptor subunit TctC
MSSRPSEPCQAGLAAGARSLASATHKGGAEQPMNDKSCAIAGRTVSTRRALLLAIPLAVAVFMPMTTWAAWPDHTVTVVVPYAAGGNTDVMARLAGQELQKRLGQPFVIENLAGAGGAVGTQNVARSRPDGHTLLFATTAQFSILPYTQKINYDPLADFAPIGVFGQSFSVLGIAKSVPATDLASFIAYVKANPGKLNYASGGVGTVGHLVSASFAERAGLDMVHVPYSGGAPAITALVAGHVGMYFGNSSEFLPHYKGTDFKIIAVGTPARVSQFPDVPAVAEVYPGFSLPAWNGLLAPAKTPQAIVDTLSKEMHAVTQDPAIQKRLRELAIEPGGAMSDEFIKIISSEQAIFKAAVKGAGIER